MDHTKPPTITLPDIALVTDISGVCSAGETARTTWYPTNVDRANVVTLPTQSAGTPVANCGEERNPLTVEEVLKLQRATAMQ